MSILPALAALLVGAAVLPAAEAAPPRYRLEWLDDVPAQYLAASLNNMGDVAGAYYTGEFISPPFLRRDGRLQILPGLDQTRATHLALNNRGDVAVSTDSYTGSRAYVYRDGHVRRLPLPMGLGGIPNAWDINEAGHVLGSAEDADGVEHSFVFDGRTSRALDTGATPVAFRALNDHGVIVGGIQQGSGVLPGAAVWRDGALSVLRPDDMGAAWHVAGIDVNNAGQVLIRAESDPWSDPVTDTWLYTDGRYERVGNPFFNPAALNEQGWVVGSVLLPSGPGGEGQAQASLYTGGTLHALDQLLRPADAARWELNKAFDINDAGQILVQGERRGTGKLGVLIATPVPEPAMLALMLAGLGVVGTAARRRAAPAGRA